MHYINSLWSLMLMVMLYHMQPSRMGPQDQSIDLILQKFRNPSKKEARRNQTLINYLLCDRHSTVINSFNKIFDLNKARHYRVIGQG